MKEIVFQKTGAESTELHHRNLQNAIRKNEPLNCDCNLGFYGVVAARWVRCPTASGSTWRIRPRNAL